MAMMNYPYKADFLKKLPANPVRVACERFEKAAGRTTGGARGEDSLLKGLAAAANVFYNSEKPERCLNQQEKQGGSLGVRQWRYQACTQLMTPMSNSGKLPEDCFLPATAWSTSQYTKDCQSEIPGVHVQFHHMSKHFGDKQ